MALLFSLGMIRSNIEDFMTLTVLLAKMSVSGKDFSFLNLSEFVYKINKFYGYLCSSPQS